MIGFSKGKHAIPHSFYFKPSMKDIAWIDISLGPERLARMKQYQKINHFVGTYAITRKNSLGRNLTRMKKYHPQAYKFFPSTWILPADTMEFKNQLCTKKIRTFIIKPDAGSQGKGIFLSQRPEDIRPDENFVAQRYIHKPLLLDGFKFDLRMYVLITGCSPLRVFLHREGLGRLATREYRAPSIDNLSCSTMHLTNYSVNKLSSSFLQSVDPDDATRGHKRSLRHVFQRLSSQGYDMEKVMADIEDLAVKTIATIQPNLAHAYNSCQPDDLSNSMCFEILGFDIILDSKLKPWLLEINHSPSFSVDSQVDQAVKSAVISDTLSLLNINIENKYRYKANLKNQISSRLIKGATPKLTREERMKQRLVISAELEQMRTRWEDDNTGGYKRIYPSVNLNDYAEYFKTAAQVWESQTGNNKKRFEHAKRQKEEKANRTRARNENIKADRIKREKEKSLRHRINAQPKCQNFGKITSKETADKLVLNDLTSYLHDPAITEKKNYQELTFPFIRGKQLIAATKVCSSSKSNVYTEDFHHNVSCRDTQFFLWKGDKERNIRKWLCHPSEVTKSIAVKKLHLHSLSKPNDC
ncbi:Tubulin-tyrosine ligase family protein [Cardiosporidium cionae]|uniref:Tubulin-tyrosine ligase family protein n=1 Tax=Cardiosporidium cionae TaxID=476202 RepID=A0ABQ7JDC4_9APIC|nr:Tubulin-tyrosine ligase family protein [Cardiosporidium cionae]|eukprot:KAF8822032.1 Tubulin-tyrosine ligase family protein [Cardiosporidium cionae]